MISWFFSQNKTEFCSHTVPLLVSSYIHLLIAILLRFTSHKYFLLYAWFWLRLIYSCLVIHCTDCSGLPEM